MFNVSKQTLWFIIMISTLILIYYIYDSSVLNDANHCSNHKYNKSIYNKENETSVIIRRKLNKKHKKTKKIHQSPKNKNLEASIRSLKDILKQKIKKTKISNNKLSEQNHPIISKINSTNQINSTPNKSTKSKKNIKLFFADWCAHCTNFKPIWNKLKSTYSNIYNFIDVDCTNDTPNLSYVYGLPTIAIYDHIDNYIENYEDQRTFSAIEAYLNNL